MIFQKIYAFIQHYYYKSRGFSKVIFEFPSAKTGGNMNLMSEMDLDVLGCWLRAAAKAESVQGFRKDCKV